MVESFQFVAVLLLLIVCSLGPGLVLLRSMRCSPVERLCLAVAVSIVILYLIAFAIYIFELPTPSFFAVSAFSAICLIGSIDELKSIWRSRYARHTIFAFLFLFVWALLHLAITRHYSGGGWAGDWVEHHQRTSFFVDHLPLGTQFINQYQLPARPPLMNLVTGIFTSQVGSDFWLFQVVMTWLNLLAFLPCVLLARWVSRSPRPALLILTLAFMCSPFFMVNATYAWTKLLAGFYVLLALHLYLSGWQRKNSLRLILAFLSMTAGVLVHYSAAPYAILVGLHYLIVVVWRQPRPVREVVIISITNLLLAATWFAWSASNYGVRGTLATNTTVTDSATLSTGENIQKMAGNVLHSTVPHPLTVSYERTSQMFSQPDQLGFARDYTFLMYQTNLMVMAGLLSLLVAGYLLSQCNMPSRLKWFWGAFISAIIILGPSTHGTADMFGVAHVVFVPLGLIVVAAIAANFTALPKWIRASVVLMWLIDFAIGIFLQFEVQSRVFQLTADNQLVHPEHALSRTALTQWYVKETLGLRFFGDLFQNYTAIVQALTVFVLVVVAVQVMRRYGVSEDQSQQIADSAD